ncbi:peptidase family M48-domain-containing protein [Hygrophoropsis aurantiaca]|uniref:Peptidase family M48-domain-containing protein n=1 Tax=Hygrophoropsis aurantiaca TaxID=72124 RepID=A0ACB8APD5_9AGAM|nr:peptidase family M48-domain-containing protein [Hygrophoropsis aurantiaca]
MFSLRLGIRSRPAVLQSQAWQTFLRSPRPLPLAQQARGIHIRRHISTSVPRKVQYVRFPSEQPRRVGGSKWDTRTQIVAVIAVGGLAYYFVHLEQVPETGRWRFMDISAKYENKLAETAYMELLSEFQGKILPANHPITRHVRRVVTGILESNDLGSLRSSEPSLLQRVRQAVSSSDDPFSTPDFSMEETHTPESGGKEWNLIVVNDPKVVNAMATFGNIIVFTGILPVCQDEQGLAAVLGHEIGHVVARHASERYSSSKVFLLLAFMLQSVGLDLGFSNLLTTLLLELPNSRTQEIEADTIGLRLTAKACYDPEAAVSMHARLAQLDRGSGFEFLRTHPDSERRITHLKSLIPEAYTIQAGSPQCAGMQKSLNHFQDTAARWS